jgi:DNA modification methylase
MQPMTLTGEQGIETRHETEPTLPTFTFLNGDARETLRTLRGESVHTIVTSPPYYALRDYQRGGQIGREATPEAFIERLVRVFREARRVLRSDGTLWVNIGDTYAGSSWKGVPHGPKRKDLIGIPWMLALALRADGWYLRCDVVWSKINCTPESAHDRPSRSHEYLFLLTRRPKYFYDRDAVREPNEGKPPTGLKATTLANRARMTVRNGAPSSSANHKDGKWAGNPEAHAGFVAWNPRGRNRRSVWRTTVSCFNPASVGVTDVDHFAVMPPALVRPCILAGTSAGGCCPNCGAPQKRVIASYEDLEDAWVPTCACPPFEPVPCTVLDPFGGSGTTAAVAKELGRSAVLIDLNADYLRLARARVAAANAPSPQSSNEPLTPSAPEPPAA